VNHFFCSTWEEWLLIMQFTTCRYLHPFQRYLQSKSKADLNRSKFWTFFAFPNFKGVVSQKLYTRYYPRLGAHHVVKFCGATPLSAKVLVAHTLHFKSILTPLLQKIVGETPVPIMVCASKPWSLYIVCKNFRA